MTNQQYKEKTFFLRDDNESIINLNNIIYISHDSSRDKNDEYHYIVRFTNYNEIKPELSKSELTRLINVLKANGVLSVKSDY